MDGLRRLEYRGYDSIGVAVWRSGKVLVEKDAVRIEPFVERLDFAALRGPCVIGHTRWATHGAPTQFNAHPHTDCTGRIAVVHNGIIENHSALRKRLLAAGHTLRSDTDTELIAHLIEEFYEGDLLAALRSAAALLAGSYAVCALCADSPRIALARMASPLVIGVGDDALFAASDPLALLSRTGRFVFLEEGDFALLQPDSFEVTDADGEPLPREVRSVRWSAQEAEKEGYPHFMLKEIWEQPRALQQTVASLIDGADLSFRQAGAIDALCEGVRRVALVACGTAFHACLVASYALRDYVGVDHWLDVGSEFRYAQPPLDEETLLVAVSQSGETADTLAPVRAAKERGARILAVCNVPTSSLVREADATLLTLAGPEIGVASTKAYTTQLAVLAALVSYLAERRGTAEPERIETLRRGLLSAAQRAHGALAAAGATAGRVAEEFHRSQTFLYLGRRYNLATAYEGALKLKEISYIHAEGYGAGEMKHGPIALVQPDYPTVAIAPRDTVYDKMLTNIQEVCARSGPVVAVATEGDEEIADVAGHVFFVPETEEVLTPMITVIPLQLLAYETAVMRGCDVDKPRNLAKSVTVE